MQGVYVTFNGTFGTPKTSLGSALNRFGIEHLLRSKRFSAGIDLTTPLPSGVAALTARRGVSTVGGASRSRSTSVMPGAEAEREGEGVADAADDKLYCICKTSYDEDRVMIACDR